MGSSHGLPNINAYLSVQIDQYIADNPTLPGENKLEVGKFF